MSNPVWFGLVARAQGIKTKHTDFFGLGFATLCESRPKVEEFAGWALISTAGAVCVCARASARPAARAVGAERCSWCSALPLRKRRCCARSVLGPARARCGWRRPLVGAGSFECDAGSLLES